jgi:hypothetical protein
LKPLPSVRWVTWTIYRLPSIECVLTHNDNVSKRATVLLGEQIPLDMCPCGARKPTVRRFLVARKYKARRPRIHTQTFYFCNRVNNVDRRTDAHNAGGEMPGGSRWCARGSACGSACLRACVFVSVRVPVAQVDEAEKMMRDTMVWRQTVAVGDVKGIDNILAAKPRWDLLSDNRKIIPASPFHCYAKQGYPVYMLRLGKGDGALATTAPEECHVYCSIMRGEHLSKVVVPEATEKYKAAGGRKGQEKRMREAARAAGETVEEPTEEAAEEDELDLMDKQVVIVDLEGIGMSALRCLWVFKTINSVAGFNYPELSKVGWVKHINTPGKREP